MNEKYKDKKILIAIPCFSGMMSTMTVSSLLQLHKPAPCAFIVVERQRIDKCRNYFIKQTLKGNFDYLLMIDDDNPVPPDTLEKLLDADKDIVMAAILSRNPNLKTGVYDLCAFYAEEKLIKTKTLRMYNPIVSFKEEGPLHKIDAGGCGAMLIKRKVLEVMSKQYEYPFSFGDITVDGQRRTMSEDVEFCERAVKQGFEIWLDDSIRPVHISNPKLIKYNG